MCENDKARPEAYEMPIAAIRRIFGTSDAERVEPWVMPAIGLHDGDLGDEPEQIGTTRFGGRPDLPSVDHWPVGPDGPLAFLGQIALSQIAEHDIDAVLPAGGMLSFFFNIYDYGWGSFENDHDKFAVRFHPQGVELHRQDFPSGIVEVNRVKRVRAVSPYLLWELPTADPLAQEALGFGECPFYNDQAPPDTFTTRYWQLHDDLVKPHIPVGKHKLLGWANGIYAQSEDCRLMCELARIGFPEEGSEAYKESHMNRPDWRCLLEISDDQDLYDDPWCDGGTIAFMIRNQDLKERNFDRCWCVLSST